MGRKKSIILEKVEIEGFADDGKCVAHHDGMAIFVSDVAPGDIVDLEAYRARKKFMNARPTKFHKYATDRTSPQCQHFGVCGGCKWQHVSYEEQLRQKAQIVEDNLSRIGKVELPPIQPILGSSQIFQYRNKLEFTFSNKRWLTKEEIESKEEIKKNALGFHIPKLFDKIVDIETCHLQEEPTNAIKNEVRRYALSNGLSFYDIREKTGFLRNLIIRITSIGEVMVILQVGCEDEALPNLLEHLKVTFPEITSLLYVINEKKNETFHDLDVHTYSGRGFIWEEMDRFSGSEEKLRFKVGPKSFFQTNSLQANTLYKQALQLANLSGDEIVYDLYTGTGSIAIYAAEKASKILGIEYVEAAIEDAKINAIENGVDNTTFVAGDMKDALNDELISQFGKPDVIITDPPRAGMHTDVTEKILEIGPEKVVYISCNPATQARDIALMDKQYQVTVVQPVDMFPHTSHIECVVLLERR